MIMNPPKNEDITVETKRTMSNSGEKRQREECLNKRRKHHRTRPLSKMPPAPINTSSMIIDAHSTPTRSLDIVYDVDFDYSSDDGNNFFASFLPYESDEDRTESADDDSASD